MHLPVTDRFRVADAAELYGIERWGNGYFRIGENGHLEVRPDAAADRGIDLYAAVSELRRQGLGTPLILRFPQLLGAQARQLHGAFRQAIDEYDYPNGFNPVFPIKVNQQRDVVEALVDGGRPYGLGLEVGSRPELLAAMAMDLPDGAPLICNGFKDAEYLGTASLAHQLGLNVIAVIEKPFEVDLLVDAYAEGVAIPHLGFRTRLQARGSGLWEKSGGFASKFGLTTLQLIRALERLDAAGLSDRPVLLHFHIGSQITEIRKVKNAVLEAGRIYAKLRKRGVAIEYLDVGGGLGIDYDGSKTSSDASMNYTVQEYANDVVFGVQEVCEREDVPMPRLVSESGRMLTAYHSVLITEVHGVISGVDPTPPPISGDEHAVIDDMHHVAQAITVKNYREYYHDAIEYRDQMYQLFNLGLLTLEERAIGENLFWGIAEKAVQYSKTAKFVAEEFQELESKLHDKYICNFSVFQSLPDHWALDQLFPVMPIHRLSEPPTRRAKLVDITCDSDGEVDRFIDLKDLKEALEVHEMRAGEPYYLAFLLVGAYQDTMGDLHNLFGRVNEAVAELGPDGATRLTVRRRGDDADTPLSHFGYDEATLVESLRARADRRVADGSFDAERAERALAGYRRALRRYTYLRRDG